MGKQVVATRRIEVLDEPCPTLNNPKFVPVTLVDYTDGYDSECAVLFPETVSTAERPSTYHFGGDLPEVEGPKELVDLVKDDEFPLSLFYVQLWPKLADVLGEAT